METALIDTLNEQQRDIVFAPMNDILVVAGAGTGKTRVLVSRIAYLVEAEGFAPQNILAVTFSNKAAHEMDERICAFFKWERNQGMWINTFHGLCYRLLRRYTAEAQLPAGFSIITPDDQEALMRKFYVDQGLEVKRGSDLEEQGFDHKSLLFELMKLKENNALPPVDPQLVEQAFTDFASFIDKGNKYEILAVFAGCYKRLCETAGVVDFADLINKMVHLLSTNNEVRTALQRRFKYICVDEFQDTNVMQYQLLMLLKSKDNHIFVVGDDDQSIYGWRGACIDNMRKLTVDLPAIKVFALTINYRSAQNILNFANALIGFNNDRMITKHLVNPGMSDFMNKEELAILSNTPSANIAAACEALQLPTDVTKLSSPERDRVIMSLYNAQKISPMDYARYTTSRWCTQGADQEVQSTQASTTKASKASKTSKTSKASKTAKSSQAALAAAALGLTDAADADDAAAAKDAGAATATSSFYGSKVRLVHLSGVANSYGKYGDRIYNQNFEEGKCILEVVKYWHNELKVPYDQIAVLYRKNSLSLSSENVFQANNIPYQIYGGMKFYDRLEIMTMMSYLRLLLNPKDNAAFLRVVNTPKRSIGEVTIKKLSDYAESCGMALYEAIMHVKQTGDKAGKKLISKFVPFYDFIERCKAEVPKRDLKSLMEFVLQESGLEAHFAAIDKKESSSRFGLSRVDNLNQLINNAATFASAPSLLDDDMADFVADAAQNAQNPQSVETDAAAGEAAGETAAPGATVGVTSVQALRSLSNEQILANFVANSALMASTESTGTGENVGRGVQVMTIHASKGLEFECVILVGFENNIMPSPLSKDIPEERRLAYVAVTRAKRELYLIHSLKRFSYRDDGLIDIDVSQFGEEAMEFYKNNRAAAPYEELIFYNNKLVPRTEALWATLTAPSDDDDDDDDDYDDDDYGGYGYYRNRRRRW